eukprot:UN18613
MTGIAWDNTKLKYVTFGKFALCESPQTFPCGYPGQKWYRTATWVLFNIPNVQQRLLFISTQLHGHIDVPTEKKYSDIHHKQFGVIENQISKIMKDTGDDKLLVMISADWNSYQNKNWWNSMT